MNERVQLFREKDEAVTSEARRRTNLLVFTVVVTIPLVLYGLLEETVRTAAWLGTFEVAVGGVLICNLLAYYVHKRHVVAELTFSFVILIALLVIFSQGGIQGTADDWLYAFPPAMFLLHGKRRGVWLNVLLLTVVAFLSFAVRTPADNTVYTFVKLRQILSALVLIMVLSYTAAAANENARNELEMQRERLRAVLGHMPAGVVMFEASDRLPSAANDSAAELLGKKIARDVRLDDFAAHYGITKENGEPFPVAELPWSRALAGEDVTAVPMMFVPIKNDGRRSLLAASAPVRDPDGHIVAAIGVFEDATKQYEAQRMKTELISLASHQLKTPLTGIKWGMDELLSGDLGDLTNDQRETVDEVQEVVSRLNQLVADLLNTSRIDTGRLKLLPQSTDIVPLIKKTVSELRHAAQQRHITMTTSKLPDRLMLQIDGMKVREVFMNLVGNAVKYSKDGGKIEIDVSEDTPSSSTITVKDDGIGIPKDEQQQVFEQFFRASNAQKDIEGTGLGLYLAKTVVTRLGGNISFESEAGKGTTFFVTLPKPKA